MQSISEQWDTWGPRHTPCFVEPERSRGTAPDGTWSCGKAKHRAKSCCERKTDQAPRKGPAHPHPRFLCQGCPALGQGGFSSEQCGLQGPRAHRPQPLTREEQALGLQTAAWSLE